MEQRPLVCAAEEQASSIPDPGLVAQGISETRANRDPIAFGF